MSCLTARAMTLAIFWPCLISFELSFLGITFNCRYAIHSLQLGCKGRGRLAALWLCDQQPAMCGQEEPVSVKYI